MNKKNYVDELEIELDDLLNNSKLKNYMGQISAKKLDAKFNKTYEENFLGENALYLSSNGCFLLEENSANPTGIKALKTAAEIYENLYYISQEYDKKYFLLLSSLCYDISGYQANAKCLIDEIEKTDYYNVDEISSNNFKLDNILKYENIFLKSVQLFLQKKIFLLNKTINGLKNEDYSYLEYRYKNFLDKYCLAISSLCSFIIEGYENSETKFHPSTELINKYFDDSYKEILYSGNILLSHIMYLFKTRIKLFSIRNIWDIMNQYVDINNYTWKTYLKLLSMDIYDNSEIKSFDNRISIFEFWNSQLNALKQNILLNEENYIIKMPTSAGKTLIAELMIIHSLIKNPNSKAVYIAPFNALVHEITQNFSKIERLGYSLSSISGAYEIDEFDFLWINTTDILVATPEKIDLLYRINSDFFNNISIIITDEGHIIGNGDNRAILLELLISKLKKNLIGTRFLYISALISEVDAHDFSKWISESEGNILTSPSINNEEWEPTKKLIGYLKWDKKNKKGTIFYPYEKIGEKKSIFIPNILKEKNYSFTTSETKEIRRRKCPKNKKSHIILELASKFVNEGSVLIFTSKPGWAESLGEKYLRLMEYKEIDKIEEEQNIDSFKISSELLGESHPVTKCLKENIGIHHGELPKEVKNAIETDFREKKIELLISTNTIGQGINFPIKTAIIHSLSLGYGKNVSIRDFWNVVGRAGRAGKETHGQVIFINMDNDKDIAIFDKYAKKDKIEPIRSYLFKIVQKLYNKRIDSSEFMADLKKNIEPSLLAILFEESVDQLDEKVIEETLDCTLFHIQIDDLEKLNCVKNAFKNIGSRFYSNYIDKGLREIYSATGLSLDSCCKINEFIKCHLEKIVNFLNDRDYASLIECILYILIDLDEMNDYKIKNELLKKHFDKLFVFTSKWIYGEDIKVLEEFWKNEFINTELENRMYLYINKFLEYRYPWGSNSFLLILLFYLGNEYNKIEDLPDEIKNIPYFIKYGLNKKIACFCKNIGIKTRNLCLEIEELYEYDYLHRDFESFLIWFSSLELNDLKNYEFLDYQIRNILDTSNNLASKRKPLFKYDTVKFDINIKDDNTEYFDKIKKGDKLSIERDINDKYNMYRINLKYDNFVIGKIPSEFSKFLAIGLDTNQLNIKTSVINKKSKFRSITIKLNILR